MSVFMTISAVGTTDAGEFGQN